MDDKELFGGYNPLFALKRQIDKTFKIDKDDCALRSLRKYFPDVTIANSEFHVAQQAIDEALRIEKAKVVAMCAAIGSGKHYI